MAHQGYPSAINPRIDIDKDLLRETLKHFDYYDVSDEDLENVYARIAELESVGETLPNVEPSYEEGDYQEDGVDGDVEQTREFVGGEYDRSEQFRKGNPLPAAHQQGLQDDAKAIEEMLRTEEEESLLMRERRKKVTHKDNAQGQRNINSAPRTSAGEPLVNNKGEYLHQQRFKPFIGLERKLASDELYNQDPSVYRPRSSSQAQRSYTGHVSQRPRSATMERAGRLSDRPPFDNNFSYPDPNDSSRHISRYTKESCFGTVPRLLTALPPNRSVLSRSASNVIYAHTDDRAYCSTTRGHPTPYNGFYRMSSQMYTSRASQRGTDLVKRGAQMRKSWDKDKFLTQKCRKDELWEVRRSMLEYRPPIGIHDGSL
eukprot:Tbor_TRINITY_DN5953_c0_g1::TRINITY_DN5953_c0_g1_i2::g.18504::m.18504